MFGCMISKQLQLNTGLFKPTLRMLFISFFKCFLICFQKQINLQQEVVVIWDIYL